MATIPWPMWCRSHTTDEVMPLDVSGPDGEITSYLVAVTAEGAAEPAANVYTSAEADGAIHGVRVGTTRNQTAGTYWAWAKVNNRVLPPVPFVLT